MITEYLRTYWPQNFHNKQNYRDHGASRDNRWTPVGTPPPREPCIALNLTTLGHWLCKGAGSGHQLGKAASSAGGSNDIQDIAYPPYRDAAAGTAVEFTSHRVVSSLEFCAVRVVFQEVLEAFAEPCPSGQELRVVQSREINWIAWLHGLPRLSCAGWRVVAV
jgi:hypothetical protein